MIVESTVPPEQPNSLQSNPLPDGTKFFQSQSAVLPLSATANSQIPQPHEGNQ